MKKENISGPVIQIETKVAKEEQMCGSKPVFGTQELL
jgi:hypothetical protein